MIKDTIKANGKVSIIDEKMDILKRNFPACFHDGEFDFVRFREYLNDKIKVNDEGYELRFIGKNYARLLAALDTTTVIVPDEEHNREPENADSQNIFISGDNLDASKHLLKSYAGKIKCVYLDPLYNTGSDGFVYNDNFTFTVEELAERLSIEEEEAKHILDLAKRGSASHSAWLMSMLPRLELVRDLLSKDGVVFISIDDNEQADLRLLCDDIFGEENMIAQFCKKGTGGKQNSTHFAKVHEYLLCYANSKFKAGEQEGNKNAYPYEDEEGSYRRVLLRKWGDEARRADRESMYYPLYLDQGIITLDNPNTLTSVAVYPKLNATDDGRWRWGADKMKLAVDKNLIELVEDKELGYVAYEKIYKATEDNAEKTKLYNTWLDDINGKTGKTLLKELFGGESPFEYPKPLDLIERVLRMSNAEDGIVLDLYGGSGTTAHAVMNLNVNENKHIKYILVQIQEPCKDDSVAKSMGFDYIDQLAMQRITLAANRIKSEHPNTKADLGFKHYILKEPSSKNLSDIESFDPNNNNLFLENSILNEFGVSTVLTTWLERDGYGMNAKPEIIDLNGYTAYLMPRHLYLIHSHLTNEAIDAIVTMYETEGNFNPQYVVLFGYSFNWPEREGLDDNLRKLQSSDKNLHVIMDVRY